jgi:hypothetical protein
MAPKARTGPFFATAFDMVFSFARLPHIDALHTKPGQEI